jgi:2-oxoglutarate ferredoxin oxidoreductase subunit alpha
MTEAIGFAAMAEIGIVVVNSMRGGPSTGLPTKTEQADLFQMLGAGQGDFPRVIMAPQDGVDAFKAGIEATEIADRFQLPVLVASDFYLSETTTTMHEELKGATSIDRGNLVDSASNGGINRYEDTPDGVSPRSLPGTPGLTFVAASDEHDEDGTLISDILAGLPNSLIVREKQVQKRDRKLTTLLKELPAPVVEGEGGPLLVCWGSTGPILREARQQLEEQGTPTRQLTLRWIMPFHTTEVGKILDGEDFLVVEGSFSGQLENYIRMRTGLSGAAHIRRYDGEPFTPQYIRQRLEPLLGKEVTA